MKSFADFARHKGTMRVVNLEGCSKIQIKNTHVVRIIGKESDFTALIVSSTPEQKLFLVNV